MLLVKMEDCSSLFPSLFMEEPFQLGDSYDNGLYGRKKKKKQSLDIAECRLDSPCNSPEVIMSGGDDIYSRCPKVSIDGIPGAHTSPGSGSDTFNGVDMERFYEINASITAGEDIMLSSSVKESKLMVKEVAGVRETLKSSVEAVHIASRNGSSASDSTTTHSEFEDNVDDLLNSSLWRIKEETLSMPAADLLPDLSGLAVSGYLLSDIPSHPDLSCEASYPIDSLLTYSTDKQDCLNGSCAVPQFEHKEDLLCRIKCEEDCSAQSHCGDAVYSDYDALCTDTQLDDMHCNMNDCPRESCQCRTRECLCYKSETSSAEEEDVCTQYIVSQLPAKLKRANRRPKRVARRGPGRPRKIQNTDFVRRGPGRPRKKSVSDAVAWYQTRRKRTVSLSNGYKSRNRQKSLSEDRDVEKCHKDTGDEYFNRKRNCKVETGVQLSSGQTAFDVRTSSSLETDEEDIVDVVSIGEEFQELYGVSTMAELVQHISTMHSYHNQRLVPRHSSTTRNCSSKFFINLPMPAKSNPSYWLDSVPVWSSSRRHRIAVEQRAKREALNDLERRRRYALARELSVLRDVLPEMKEGFRAAKVVILAAAENHIRLLERKLRRDQNILKAERERNTNLKTKLEALSVNKSA